MTHNIEISRLSPVTRPSRRFSLVPAALTASLALLLTLGAANALANNGGDDTISAVTAMGYDAYYFALQAIENAASTDPADIMEALWSTEIDGVTGHIALEQVNGDAIRNTVYVKHANTSTGGWDALPAVVVD